MKSQKQSESRALVDGWNALQQLWRDNDILEKTRASSPVIQKDL